MRSLTQRTLHYFKIIYYASLSIIVKICFCWHSFSLLKKIHLMVKWIDLSEAIYGGLSSSPDKLKLTANVVVVSFILV